MRAAAGGADLFCFHAKGGKTVQAVIHPERHALHSGTRKVARALRFCVRAKPYARSIGHIRRTFAFEIRQQNEAITSGANFGGETHSTSANATSAFVAVFDATGLTKWSRVFATQELDVAEAYDLLIAKDGTVTLIAFFQNTGNVSFGGDVLPDGHAMVVARYDAEGGHVWSKPFGGVYSHLRRLVQGAKGTLYVAGWESPGAAQENFVARLSAEGEEVARWEFPLEEKQEPVALIPVSGGFYFVGRIYDPYENQENFFLLRMTEGFLIEYSMDLGGKHTDILTSAALAKESELVLAGSTNSATIEFGENALTNEGGGKDTPSTLMLFRLSGL